MARDETTAQTEQQNTHQTQVSTAEITKVIEDIVQQKDPFDERVICYAQPIYDTHTHSFRQAEVLMRLKVGEVIVGPQRFIHLAEKNGSIVDLTCILLNKVCRAMSTLLANSNFDGISINLSPAMLGGSEIAQNTQQIFKTNRTKLQKLCVELTEQAITGTKEEQDALRSRMNGMSQAGIRLYLDDFGTGYSSIARVTSYPFSVIKIDKEVLDIAVTNPCMQELIKKIISILKKYGYEVLMEGVENEQGKQFSLNSKVDYIQGFLYAKPVPLEELVNYFQPIGQQEKKREEKNERK